MSLHDAMRAAMAWCLRHRLVDPVRVCYSVDVERWGTRWLATYRRSDGLTVKGFIS